MAGHEVEGAGVTLSSWVRPVALYPQGYQAAQASQPDVIKMSSNLPSTDSMGVDIRV